VSETTILMNNKMYQKRTTFVWTKLERKVENVRNFGGASIR